MSEERGWGVDSVCFCGHKAGGHEGWGAGAGGGIYDMARVAISVKNRSSLMLACDVDRITLFSGSKVGKKNGQAKICLVCFLYVCVCLYKLNVQGRGW